MLKVNFAAVALCALGVPLLAATATKAHKRHHGAALTTAHTAQTHRTATHHRRGKQSRRRHVVRRRYQEFPTPERYQEIQQALASKGFFKGDANGAWGPDSIDALKRFQTSQNLTPDGKISSLSLIALGLGPKRLTAQSTTTAQPPGAPSRQPGADPATQATPRQ